MVVTNTGRPAWPSETVWHLVEDLRLGTATSEGPEAERFGDVVSVTSDSRGIIYVLDRLSQEIRVFRPDGTFSHTIGDRGSGPGEFEFARAMAFAPDGTLWVLDDGAMRYSAFAPDGTLLESHRRHIIGSGSGLLRTFLRDGRYVDWAPAFPEGRFGPRVLYYPIRFAAGFERADTLPPLQHAWPMLPSGRMPQSYFTGDLVGAVDDGGDIWFANSREYRIHRRTLEGDTTLVFTLPVTAAPLTDEDRTYVRRAFSPMPPILAEHLEALPETKPIVHRILPDDAGHVFVLADVAGEPAGTIVDVFQESGAYLGRMRLPTPIPIRPRDYPVVHVTPAHLFVVVEDELGVPYVLRLRVVRGAG